MRESLIYIGNTMKIKLRYKGGKGSGFEGHAGRPGKVGGSSSGGSFPDILKKFTKGGSDVVIQQYRGDMPSKPLIGGREQGYVPPRDFTDYREAYARGIYTDTDTKTAYGRKRYWEMEGHKVSSRSFKIVPGKTLDLTTQEGVDILHKMQKSSYDIARSDRKIDFQDLLTNTLKDSGYHYVYGGGYRGEPGELLVLYPEDLELYDGKVPS